MRINVDWLPINFANFVAIHPKTDLLTGKTNYYSRELKAWWNMFTKHRVWSHPSSTVSTWPSSWLNPLSSLISSHCWLCIFHIYFQSPLLHQFVPPVKHVSHFFLWFCCQYHVISILSSSHWPSPLANLVAFSITVIKSSGLRADPWCTVLPLMSKASDIPATVFTLGLDSFYRDMTAVFLVLFVSTVPLQLLSLALGRMPSPDPQGHDSVSSFFTELFLQLPRKNCICCWPSWAKAKLLTINFYQFP